MIFLGGINGSGKTAVCKAIERAYGLKCSDVPRVCYDERDILAFEIYAFGLTLYKASADVVDESPLTHELYVNAASEFFNLDADLTRQVSEGIRLTTLKLKEEKHKFVWLTADPLTILNRLKAGKESGCRYRPFIEEVSFLLGMMKVIEEKLINEWRSAGVLDLVIDTTSKSPEEVAEEVWRSLEGQSRG